MSASTWVDGAAGSPYDIDNLPYGVFSLGDESPRVCVRIGDYALDLAPAAAADMFPVAHLFEAGDLAPFMGAGRAMWTSVREWVTALLSDEAERSLVEPLLVPVDELTMHLPVAVADYVDFYCSLDHATNVGRIFRPDEEPLKPNWRHLPVGYHGRAGTVVASGTAVRRPSGQRTAPDAPAPTYGPSQRLDIEAELAFLVGTPSPIGEPVGVGGFEEHVFGAALLNDWSARDIQAWEYVPLGPFLGKSFATSIAAWVTPLEALEAAKVDLPGQDPEPLEYLRVGAGAGYDIDLEVELNGEVVSRPPYRTMYWSPAQMLAHMTVNGASLRTGDVFASGTVSGPDKQQRGSFLELSWGGEEPFDVGGRGRTFLEDGDTVTIRASAPGANGGRLALGEVSGSVTAS
uniref:fumarylacetoacetase n=1 Tax=uncultured Nocardioidaceae bacterium TaxID=253824 RepID=A0A6J4M8R3_9ACTN|nr:MAG: Fumarylacetoacetase [uncultured Nocardioidaceae bacterium]